MVECLGQRGLYALQAIRHRVREGRAHFLAPALPWGELGAVRRQMHRRAPIRPREAAARVGPPVLQHHRDRPRRDCLPLLA